MRPVVVCPDMSSPAQSLASVINVPSNSLPCRAAFCSFCFGSLGANSGSFRQHKKAKARQSRTIRRPAKKVNILDSKKHHHLRIFKQSSSGGSSLVSCSHVDDDIVTKQRRRRLYYCLMNVVFDASSSFFFFFFFFFFWPGPPL